MGFWLLPPPRWESTLVPTLEGLYSFNTILLPLASVHDTIDSN